MPLLDVPATETVVADGNAQPGNEARHTRGVQQPQVDRLVAEHGGQETETRNHRGRIQRVARHATARQFRENTRRFTVAGQGVEHAGGGVHPGVTRRQYRRQDHRVHHRRR